MCEAGRRLRRVYCGEVTDTVQKGPIYREMGTFSQKNGLFSPVRPMAKGQNKNEQKPIESRKAAGSSEPAECKVYFRPAATDDVGDGGG